MSIEAFTWALTSQGIRDAARKLVLAGLANHAHKDGRHAWASKKTLAEYVECDPKTVGRHLKVLLAEGWIREGDQEQVSHVRADRRPVVYDLAMDEATRLEWKADLAATTRGDNLSPRSDVTGGHQPVPSSEPHEGTHGGTTTTSRGDTAVSPEPSTKPSNQPPNPPTAVPGCRRHTTTTADCRGCGTTPRQQAARAARAAAETRRLADRAAAAESRAQRASASKPTVDYRSIYAETRAGTR